MDYTKSGTASLNKPAPAHTQTKGAPQISFGQSAANRQALLARMKAAAEARKAK